jgi:hypothetical protein
MSSYGWSYPISLQRIQSVRAVAHINRGFEIQLKAYSHANYDVYIAQQVLLQGRVRAVQSYRSIEGNTADDLMVKASARKKFGSLHTIGSNGNTSSRRHCSTSGTNKPPGSKRSWGNAKDDDDSLSSTSEDAEEDEESLMEGVHHSDPSGVDASTGGPSSSRGKHSSSTPGHHHHHAGPVSLSTSPRHSSTTHTSSADPSSSTVALLDHHQTNSFKLRQQVPLMDPRSPRLRLSRPGSTSIRVIPPLRGLERVFCCSWCHSQLFNLASVIRTDVHVHPLPDPQEANITAGEKHQLSTGRSAGGGSGGGGAHVMSLISPRRDKQDSQEKESFNSYLMPAPSPRWSNTVPLSSHEEQPSFPDDAKTSSLPLSGNKSFNSPRLAAGASGGGIRGGGVGGSALYKSPPKTMRAKGGGAKSFDFDFENAGATTTVAHGVATSSPRGSTNLTSFREAEEESERVTSPMEISDEKLSPLKESKLESAFTTKDERNYLLEPPPQSLPSSRRSSKICSGEDTAAVAGAAASPIPPHLSSLSRSGSNSNSYRGKAPGGILSAMGSSGSHLLSAEASAAVESPRIAFPHGASRESYSYPSNRPQSAEKRRWLARVNLLKADATSSHETYHESAGDQSDPFNGHSSSRSHKHDEKVAKLSSDDDEAIQLGFGREKYIHLEYLEWMGEDVLSTAMEAGELKCGNCRCVIGSWTWNPSSRSLPHLILCSFSPLSLFLF